MKDFFLDLKKSYLGNLAFTLPLERPRGLRGVLDGLHHQLLHLCTPFCSFMVSMMSQFVLWLLPIHPQSPPLSL